MAPPVSFTKATLPYPVYAADFDPYNRGYLVVGGGGGEGRSGVPNQITLLDVSSRASLDVAAEVDLPRDEDAVMSLANLGSKDGLVVFAGINSSTPEREADRNKHLRSFKVEYPPRTKPAKDSSAEPPKGSISSIGKTQLFKPPTSATAKNENYQRVLRLSPAQKRESGSKRIGAIATGLNPVSELVVFDATSAVPSDWDVIQRIAPKEGKEVNDVDICEPSQGEFSVAYCLDHQVFVSRINYDFEKKRATSATPAKDPVPAYTLPFPDVFKAGASRPTIKYLRFLTPHHILLCCNLPQRKGAELLILRKRPDEPGEVILRKKLPGRMKAAGGLDVCALDADRVTGARQVVVAVAGHDISIELYTIEYSGTRTDSLSRFSSFMTLRDVHPLQMTKLAFAPFHSPWQAESPDANPKTPGPQYLRLASTSLGNTVVVDTFPLRPLHTKKPWSRYIFSGGSNTIVDKGLPVLVIGFCLLVTLLCLQSYIEYSAQGSGEPAITILPIPQGLRDAFTQLQRPLPPGARMPEGVPNINVGEKAGDAYAAAAEAIVKLTSTRRLKDLLAEYAPGYLHHHQSSSSSSSADEAVAVSDPQSKAIVVRAGPTEDDPEAGALSTEVHASTADALAADAHARRWEQLSEEQRQRWKQRLVRAGAWAVEEGEVILKGILFSEYAGFVGRMAGEALAGERK